MNFFFFEVFHPVSFYDAELILQLLAFCFLAQAPFPLLILTIFIAISS